MSRRNQEMNFQMTPYNPNTQPYRYQNPYQQPSNQQYYRQNEYQQPPPVKPAQVEVKFKEEQYEGPVEKRQCTDVFCCVLFVLAFSTFIGIAVYGYVMGKPSDLLGIYNDNKQMCSATNSPLAFMPSFLDSNFTAVCVSKCPKMAESVSCLGSICGSGVTAVYSSIEVGGVFCMPDIGSAVTQVINISVLTQVFADIKISYLVLLGALAAAFLLGFIYFGLMRCCAGVLVWLSLTIFILGTMAVGIYMFMYTKGIKLIDVPFDLSTYSSQNLQITSYVLWGVSILTIIMVICCWNRIRLAIAVVKTTSMYLSQICHVVFFPPCMAIFMILVLALIIIGFFFIYSVGTINIQSPFATVDRTDITNYLMYYQMCAGFWIVFFVSGFTSFVLTSSACIWYYSNNGDGKPHRPILTSIRIAFRYHLGTIAFGSLILALLAILRIMVKILQQKPAANPSKCTQFMYKCASCCLTCLNCFMKYLTKSAYIQVAVKGYNYCKGAIEAFKITVENPLRIGINSGLSSLTMFIGKATITSLVGVAAYYSLLRIDYFSLRISSPLAPTIMCGVIALAVASIYMSVFGISCNAIIQCFIMDETSNQAKGRPAKYCPEPLRQLLQSHMLDESQQQKEETKK